MPRPLFIMGNKRSGTSHLVALLNAHPEIFVAPEADVVWALYRRATGQSLEPYPEDGPRGLAATLERVGSYIANAECSKQAFAQVLSELMRDLGKAPDDLQWMGDKKPVQHADPEVLKFILDTWPDARFLHIVRHPRAVIASKLKGLAGPLSFMDAWRRDEAALLQFWVNNEQRVLDHKAAGVPIHSLTLPQLVADPTHAMNGVLSFLDLLPADDGYARIVATETAGQSPDHKYDEHQLSLTTDARHLVELYDL